MRFVPAHCIREDMILGKSLYGRSGELLLSTGCVMQSKYIRKIRALGFNGIYINDENSKDIEILTVISDELRIKAVRSIKNVFIKAENKANEDALNKSILETKKLIKDMVDEIMSNKDVMVNMIDLKIYDDYTFYHSVNTTVLSMIIGVAVGLNREDLNKLGLAALFHDVGKIFISKDILNKPGILNPEEKLEMDKHSDYGYRYAKETFDIPIHSCVGIYQHHEKVDGTGYPDGTAGEQISLFAKIISIADVYDALNSDRPYRKAELASDAMEFIMAGSGSSFDPDLVFLFTRKVAAFPIGTYVKLSDGQVGIVVENYEDCCMRPKIKLLSNILKNDRYLDLKNDSDYRNVTVVGIAEY